MKILEKQEVIIKLLVVCSVIMTLPLFSLYLEIDLVLKRALILASTICFFPVVFLFFKSTFHWKIFQPLKYFGQHSLEVLVTHGLVLSVIRSFIFKIYLQLPSETPVPNAWLYTILIFSVCALLEYFIIIKLCDKYLYRFLGKPKLS